MKYVKHIANTITVLALAFIAFSSFTSPAESENAAYTTQEAMLGEVKIWMGHFEPEGWRVCDGREIDYQKNKDLYRVIGNQFGGTVDNKGTWDETDDTGTFKLPDLSSKRIVNLGVNNWDYYNYTGQYIICTKGVYPKYWDTWGSHYDDGIPSGW